MELQCNIEVVHSGSLPPPGALRNTRTFFIVIFRFKTHVTESHLVSSSPSLTGLVHDTLSGLNCAFYVIFYFFSMSAHVQPNHIHPTDTVPWQLKTGTGQIGEMGFNFTIRENVQIYNSINLSDNVWYGNVYAHLHSHRYILYALLCTRTSSFLAKSHYLDFLFQNHPT